jgi:hypothetical protein
LKISDPWNILITHSRAALNGTFGVLRNVKVYTVSEEPVKIALSGSSC